MPRRRDGTTGRPRCLSASFGSSALIDDKEYYECARLLIEQHGDEAEVVVALKLDAAFEKDLVEECAMWRLVLAAMVELRQFRPGPDDTLH
jgi:hypothetical protein